MPANAARRAHLADAGLRVLAREGARGLTHRAVDRQAGVPVGTSANYFPSRVELLGALGNRVFERLAPDPARLEVLAQRPPDLESFTEYMRYIVERTTADPDLTIALMELRLEARRQPGLADVLGATLERNYRLDTEFAGQAGFRVGPFEIALMHYAMDGLLLDLLTPSIGAEASTDEIVRALVQRILAPPAAET